MSPNYLVKSLPSEANFIKSESPPQSILLFCVQVCELKRPLIHIKCLKVINKTAFQQISEAPSFPSAMFSLEKPDGT